MADGLFRQLNRRTRPIENFERRTGFHYCVRGTEMDTEFGVNYGREFHINSVEVSHAIMLQEIGFFGPFTKNIENYNVEIDIYESSRSNYYCISKKKIETEISAWKDQIFFVDIKDGLVMKPGFRYHIKFKLNGDITAKIKDGKSENTVVVAAGGQTICFEWKNNNNCSQQMPVIGFKVLTGDQIRRIVNGIYPSEFPLLCCNIL